MVVDDGIIHLDILYFFPHRYAAGKTSSTLIVVLGLPEIGLEGSLQYFLSINYP